MTKLYDSTNPAGVRLNPSTNKLETTPGVCAGMTAVWCLKMSLGLPAAQTQPGLEESKYLQFAYDMHTRNMKTMILEFLPRARLAWEAQSAWQSEGRGQMLAIRGEGEGHTYFWGYPGHAIGAARRDKKYYVFNPDDGLYEFAGYSGFSAHMEERYKDKLDQHAEWTMFMVAADKQYANNPKYRGTDKL
jgi:hypothetical protein